MKPKDFELVLANRIDLIKTVLSQKAEEYSSIGDRLYNFKMGAVLARQSPKEYLWSLATKHLTNVMDIALGNLPNNKELVSEKIGDLINYLILLEALLSEERVGIIEDKAVE